MSRISFLDLPLQLLLEQIRFILSLLEVAQQRFVAQHAAILAQLLIIDSQRVASCIVMRRWEEMNPEKMGQRE